LWGCFWAFAAERADSIGVDVINSSLGYNTFDDPAMDYTIFDLDGTKALISNTARKATEKGIVVVTSAGNEGNNNFWKLVTTPADAVGVISVGSITSLGTKSSFSSIGPTTDGRIKPEVVALGSGTILISSSGTLSSGNGTSFASPLVASLAAGLIQAFPNTSPLEIYQAILRSSSLYKTPNNQLGYGIPNFIIAKSYLKYGVLKDAISVFPNPVGNEKLNILFREPIGNTTTISVFDLYGKKLSEYTTFITWENDPLQYDLSMLTNGIYLFQIVDDKNKLIVKVVKSD
jgi:subtilisin family serine protease